MIGVHVGGCGVRLGGEFWAGMEAEREYAHAAGIDVREDEHCAEGISGRRVPRAIFCDLDDGAVDALRGNCVRGGMFDPASFVSSTPYASANTFARGRYSAAADGLVAHAQDQLRRQVEALPGSGLQRIHHAFALGGGAGSGVGSAMVMRCDEQYRGHLNAATLVWPSVTRAAGESPTGKKRVVAQSDACSVVAAYNAVLAAHWAVELLHASFNFTVDAAQRQGSHLFTATVPDRGFSRANRAIQRTMSAVESLSRFRQVQHNNNSSGSPPPSGDNRTSLRAMVTNLVPFPRLHFFTSAHTRTEPNADADADAVPGPPARGAANGDAGSDGQDRARPPKRSGRTLPRFHLEPSHGASRLELALVHRLYDVRRLSCSLGDTADEVVAALGGKAAAHEAARERLPTIASGVILRGPGSSAFGCSSAFHEFEPAPQSGGRPPGARPFGFDHVLWVPGHVATAVAAPDNAAGVPSATLLVNGGDMMDVWRPLSDAFCAMFRRKAFLHLYTVEGMDEMEFTEAESNLYDLISELQPVRHFFGDIPCDDEEEGDFDEERW